MSKTSLFSIIKGNIKYAFCKEKNCSLRYYPNHRRIVGGSIVSCKKTVKKG